MEGEQNGQFLVDQGNSVSAHRYIPRVRALVYSSEAEKDYQEKKTCEGKNSCEEKKAY
jgi:hypothetical protein